jgi:hypothetical protein
VGDHMPLALDLAVPDGAWTSIADAVSAG